MVDYAHAQSVHIYRAAGADGTVTSGRRLLLP